MATYSTDQLVDSGLLENFRQFADCETARADDESTRATGEANRAEATGCRLLRVERLADRLATLENPVVAAATTDPRHKLKEMTGPNQTDRPSPGSTTAEPGIYQRSTRCLPMPLETSAEPNSEKSPQQRELETSSCSS